MRLVPQVDAAPLVSAAELRAPFPWYGGKRRWARDIWGRFGPADLYVEPFAGSLAVLLAAERPAQREVVCDTDGLICNFWRALAADPGAVAYHADWPSIHQDLTARHAWLMRWGKEHADDLASDPHFFDANAAGWWVWGLGLWIGGGWCSAGGDKIPYTGTNGSGQGVSAQRTRGDRIPHIGGSGGGQGVSAQRVGGDQIPHIGSKGGGQGVSAQRAGGDRIPHIGNNGGGQGVSAQRTRGDSLLPWFDSLAARLKGVVVLNRGWRSALSPSVLMDSPTGPGERLNRCILLDPPYLTERRMAIYGSDLDGTSDDAARESYAWAVDHGERYRIAYCCHEGDFPEPAGWSTQTRTFAKNVNRAGTKDMVMYSPACAPVAQTDMFE